MANSNTKQTQEKEQEVEQTFIIKQIPDELKDAPTTSEQWVKIIERKVLNHYLSGANGMELRATISQELLKVPDKMKQEVTLPLRQKFDRLKQFGELSSQEVQAVTSQKGW
jgi:hypothetical protein